MECCYCLFEDLELKCPIVRRGHLDSTVKLNNHRETGIYIISWKFFVDKTLHRRMDNQSVAFIQTTE